MIIRMKDVANCEILSGAVNGKHAFASLISDTSDEPETPTALFLDFTDVDVATASFLRESVIALKAYKRTVGSNHYPVVCNINDSISDEIAVLTDARNDVIMACDLDEGGGVSRVRMIGDLDPKQALTLNLVLDLNEADAGSLMERFGESEKTTSTTAWNNRLAGLVSRGLVREYTRGRAKFYRPLFEEVQ